MVSNKMKTYARILGGLVAELFSTAGDITQMFVPSLIWVDVTSVSPAPTVGWSATQSAGAWSFAAPAGPTLAQTQTAQIALLAQSYQTAIAQSVTFTTAGNITKSFQADPGSISNVQNMLAAYTAKGSVPTGFYWLAADNTQVTFTLADLQGLAKAMGDQGWTAFQHLQTQKAAISAATTVAAVQAIVW